MRAPPLSLRSAAGREPGHKVCRCRSAKAKPDLYHLGVFGAFHTLALAAQKPFVPPTSGCDVTTASETRSYQSCWRPRSGTLRSGCAKLLLKYQAGVWWRLMQSAVSAAVSVADLCPAVFISSASKKTPSNIHQKKSIDAHSHLDPVNVIQCGVKSLKRAECFHGDHPQASSFLSPLE